MSTRALRGIEIAEVDESAVASYLEAYPDFFVRHAQLLGKVRLADARNGGTTVSLLERQVEVMRERSRQVENKMAEYIEIARENDALTNRIHKLALRLVAAHDRDSVVAAIEASLREDFGAEYAVLVLRHNGEVDIQPEGRFLRLAGKDDAALRSFATLLDSGRPRCGQLRDSQRDFLFGTDGLAIGSAALVPLGDQGSLGLLACGSPDAQRFNPAMSTDYLEQVAALIAAALAQD